jgi:hypothetical protein
MSIERELLKRFMIELTTEEDVVSLFNDIKECLAQPEQSEQDPVVKITSIHADGENLPVAITGVVLSDAVNIWGLPIKNNDFLFLAPPKRESLSDEEVRAKYRDIALDNPLYVPSYYAGFRDAERTHGIGGGG